MGVWKRANGTWFYRFDYKGKQRWQGGFKTKREAQDAEAELRARFQGQKTLLTFAEVAQMRVAEVTTYSSKNHAKRVATCLARFAEEWGNLFIGEISQPMIKEWVRRMVPAHGKPWVNKHLVFLKSMFNQAVSEGMLTESPAKSIIKLGVDSVRKRIHPVDNIKRIIDLATPEDAAYLTVTWLTAARIREVNALRWEDVDLEQGTLVLYTRKKTGGARKPRQVPMVKAVQDAVRSMLGKPGPWVFTNPEMMRRYPHDPERWKYDYRDKFHKRLAREAGVPPINYHELRHHCASYLLSQGVELTVIQAILGHERATTTDLYLQSLPGAVKNGMKVLEDI